MHGQLSRPHLQDRLRHLHEELQEEIEIGDARYGAGALAVFDAASRAKLADLTLPAHPEYSGIHLFSAATIRFTYNEEIAAVYDAVIENLLHLLTVGYDP